jgi:hypothetical protein
MTEIKTGGAAFPHAVMRQNNEVEINNGLTIRDYFAAKAMQGFCAHGSSNPITQKALAEFSYQMADAMLAERERGK